MSNNLKARQAAWDAAAEKSPKIEKGGKSAYFATQGGKFQCFHRPGSNKK